MVDGGHQLGDVRKLSSKFALHFGLHLRIGACGVVEQFVREPQEPAAHRMHYVVDEIDRQASLPELTPHPRRRDLSAYQYRTSPNERSPARLAPYQEPRIGLFYGVARTSFIASTANCVADTRRHLGNSMDAVRRHRKAKMWS